MHKSFAIEYAKRGWPVFPCAVSGKIPLTINGYKDASSDPAVVEKMFEKHPNCNIGLVTGKVSGLFVLDVDVKNKAGGDVSLIELEKSHSKIPPTVRSSTWSKGRHIFFKYPEHGIGCKAGIKPGIDIRGDGGYVIAPPSTINGGGYEWEKGCGPGEIPLAAAPGWLIDLIDERKPGVDLTDSTIKLIKGKRNSTLASIAGGMRRYGISAEEIESLLQKINIERCDPALSKREVSAIAHSVAKYEPEKEGKAKAFNGNAIAKTILNEHTIIFCGDNFYIYNGSVYKMVDENFIKKFIAEKLQNEFNIHRCSEVLHSLKVKVALNDIKQLNHSDLLNLQNGMFNTETYELTKHNPLDFSTIQLPVSYDLSATCPLWLKTLNEIFPDEKEKIDLLQEYFGLCLTKSVKHEKALFLLGEGRNGKSTVISVLQHILGQENYSAVTLESLTKPNYCAEIFGKLANISEETSAKTSICDSTFKSIISGNATLSDRKYGHPFMFFPICKMIYALNNMPQVNDKTDSYFKRLIIINFTRKFEDVEQDRQLKNKLRLEANGIFLWMLEGLKRLNERGYFSISAAIEASTEEYRRENNNVLVFVEEECKLESSLSITKKQLYEEYFQWCKSVGMHPVSKKKFGMLLIKHYKLDRGLTHSSSNERVWNGIDLIESFNFINKKVYEKVDL